MSNPQSDTQASSAFTDLIISVIIPSVILIKLSTPEYLGSVNALILALSFPITWGLYQLFKYKKRSYIALLGLISVLLTGSIGLFKLPTEWLAIKEAAIPSIIGIAVFISGFTRYPFIKTLMFNPNVMNVDKITQALTEKNNKEQFERRLANANLFFSATFVFSAVMNYLLAIWLVTSPSGTAAFNEELGEMTLYSYPIIAIPSLIMMMFIMYYLWKTLSGLTGLSLEEIMVDSSK